MGQALSFLQNELETNFVLHILGRLRAIDRNDQFLGAE